MNRRPALEKPQINEVASLLIPIVDRLLLVPTVTVAEMVPYQEPLHNPDAPDWYLGDVGWRELQVPLISFEGIIGEARPSYNNQCRIAILNNTGVDEKLPFLAIATQGIPRLSRVKADEIQEIEGAQLKRFELMAVSHAGESVIIPNVAALEQAFVEYRSK
jgi:chemosensory pili system protein ChpC